MSQDTVAILSNEPIERLVEVARVETEDGSVVARLLTLMGRNPGYMTPEKVRDIWGKIIEHPVLFTDEHGTKIDGFLVSILDPRGVWFELYSIENEEPIGLVYITDIVPGFDALGHYTIWDAKVRGKEPIMKAVMGWVFTQYQLRRMSAEIPVYQRGVIRSVQRLGFVEEGTRRKSAYRNGEWFDKVIMGILAEEVDDG